MTQTDVRPNAELAYRVLDHIDAYPESWVQNTWWGETACGTAGCFAGWAVALSGGKIEREGLDTVVTDGPPDIVHLEVPHAAEKLLRASPLINQGGYHNGGDLFAPFNDRDDLGRIVEEIFGPRPTDVKELEAEVPATT